MLRRLMAHDATFSSKGQKARSKCPERCRHLFPESPQMISSHPSLTHRDLISNAQLLGPNWSGKLMGRPGGVGLKLFKVDAGGLAREMHPGYDEALLMLEGAVDMVMEGVHVSLRAGDLQIIPAGIWHEILPGGHGSFLLVDPEP